MSKFLKNIHRKVEPAKIHKFHKDFIVKKLTNKVNNKFFGILSEQPL